MNDLIGKLVVSTSGRDDKNIYLVYTVNGKYAYLVDGNYRKFINPKKKNLKHLKVLNAESETIRDKINKNLKVFDSEIYSFIKKYKKEIEI